MDCNRLIGRGDELPWRLPADLRHFKLLTMGRPILMGRRTWESLGRPLPGRHNIVLTRDQAFTSEGCSIVHSVDEALATAGAVEEIMVIGGAVLYAEMLPKAERMQLTLIDAVFEGDVFFPPYDEREWREVACELNEPDEKNPHRYRFVTLERCP